MSAVVHTTDVPPDLAYHLLRHALDKFKKNSAELSDTEYESVRLQAQKSLSLETRVLQSREAGNIVIPAQQLQHAVDEISARYTSTAEFEQDLNVNGLSRDILEQALLRELTFDAVMQKVASRSVSLSDLDLRLYYEMNRDKFSSPEMREARHILITINEQFAENSADAALARIAELKVKLKGRSNRFIDFARRYSECPSAMDGGKLGLLARGQLFPELDEVLFGMQSGEVSDVVESEMGYHLLLCEKIQPQKKIAFNKVKGKIEQLLTQRSQRNCQKQWLSKLEHESVE